MINWAIKALLIFGIVFSALAGQVQFHKDHIHDKNHAPSVFDFNLSEDEPISGAQNTTNLSADFLQVYYLDMNVTLCSPDIAQFQFSPTILIPAVEPRHELTNLPPPTTPVA